MERIDPLEVTPQLPNELVGQLIKDLKLDPSDLVAVARSTSLKPFGNCYWNVAAQVETDGGALVTGWAIRWWPGLYAVAHHHAVWGSEEGMLLDLTEAHGPDQASPHTLFIADSRTDVSVYQPPMIPNRYRLAADDSELRSYIGAYLDRTSVHAALAALAFEAGYRSQRQFAAARGAEYRGPPTKVADRYEPRWRELESRAAFLEKQIAYQLARLHHRYPISAAL